MVYMDPNELGWRPYVKSWMQRTCTKMKDETKVLKLYGIFNMCEQVNLVLKTKVMTCLKIPDSSAQWNFQCKVFNFQHSL